MVEDPLDDVARDGVDEADDLHAVTAASADEEIDFPRVLDDRRLAARVAPRHDGQPPEALDARQHRVLAPAKALDELAVLNERHARIVACRFFGGLTLEEIAGLVGRL